MVDGHDLTRLQGRVSSAKGSEMMKRLTEEVFTVERGAEGGTSFVVECQSQ